MVTESVLGVTVMADPEPPEETDKEWLWSPVVEDEKAGISI